MKIPIRAVIADDERLARQKLRVLLADESHVSVVAECQDGIETVAAVRTHRPNLLFLDVRMPRLDGLHVLDALPADPLRMVVFTTAFDQYAVDAFEADAVDYLLKPFDRNRLQRALEKARTYLVKSAGGASSPGDARQMPQAATSDRPCGARLIIKSAGRHVFLDAGDIDWIEAAANYVRVHASGECYTLREPIGRLALRLDAKRFVRVHRSTIVNVERIRELQPCESGEFIAVLATGKALSCSRRYRSDIQRLLAGVN